MLDAGTTIAAPAGARHAAFVPRSEGEVWAPSLARQLFALAVLALAITHAVTYHAASIAKGGDPWMTGDWLINYGGGFVRRGLFGQLFLEYAPPGSPGLLALFAIQMACYGVVLVYGLQVLHRTRYSWSSIALICGPAGIAFIGWDEKGGFRKEILIFVTLALLAWSRSRSRSRPAAVLLVGGALALWVLGVFSWEPTALLLPPVLYLLLIDADPALLVFRRSAAALFVAVAVVGAGLSTLAHGDAATATAICNAAREHGFLGTELCSSPIAAGGAIEAVGWTSAQAIKDVTASYALYVGYFPLIALALTPAVASRWFRTNWKWGVAIALGVLPLYLIATDYGRWTHILVIALTFCITADDPADSTSPIWNPLVAVLYVVLWGLPHHIAPDAEWKWFGAVSLLVNDAIGWLSTVLGVPVYPGLTETVIK